MYTQQKLCQLSQQQKTGVTRKKKKKEVMRFKRKWKVFLDVDKGSYIKIQDTGIMPR